VSAFRKFPARLPHKGAPDVGTGASSNRANGVERPSRQNRSRVHAMAAHAKVIASASRGPGSVVVCLFAFWKDAFRVRKKKKNRAPGNFRPPGIRISDQMPIRKKALRDSSWRKSNASFRK
jgi:hypothetical protein